ncbi:teashirt homolog 3-like isoform X1 [Lates japonicus]|uniref:Teashirt homolog 3-like isoform X1 n=1 Tax=Lates japonicus TaxID=270547 RepID=A0AAD3RPA1_LATJO|nr:teashirt homolog 3-like isoform X1 [Lates japonicus]
MSLWSKAGPAKEQACDRNQLGHDFGTRDGQWSHISPRPVTRLSDFETPPEEAGGILVTAPLNGGTKTLP